MLLQNASPKSVNRALASSTVWRAAVTVASWYPEINPSSTNGAFLVVVLPLSIEQSSQEQEFTGIEPLGNLEKSITKHFLCISSVDLVSAVEHRHQSL